MAEVCPMRGSSNWKERERLRGPELSRAWATWLGVVEWQLFATLTFDPKRRFPVGMELASREAFWWCTQTGVLLRRPVGWLYAVERGRGGIWHAHALLAGVAAGLGPVLPAMWEQRNGIFHQRPVDGTSRAVLYTTKDAALNGEIVLSDTIRRYMASASALPRVALHPDFSGSRPDET